jgi:hypothetical protein
MTALCLTMTIVLVSKPCNPIRPHRPSSTSITASRERYFISRDKSPDKAPIFHVQDAGLVAHAYPRPSIYNRNQVKTWLILLRARPCPKCDQSHHSHSKDISTSFSSPNSSSSAQGLLPDVAATPTPRPAAAPTPPPTAIAPYG